MKKEENIRRPNFLTEMISGYFGGAAYIFSGQPLDIIKVRFQSGNESSVYQSFKHILNNEGVLAFWKGSFFPLATVGVSIAVLFSANEELKHQYRRIRSKANLGFAELFLIGGTAGMAYAAVVCPVEHIKIRIQMQEEGNTLYKNSIDCARKLFKEQGIRGLFKGLGPTLLREFLGCGGYFATYFYLREYFQSESKALTMVFGGLSGIMAWNLTFWIDNFKSRVQADSFQTPIYKGLKTIWHLKLKDLTKGYVPGMVKAFPSNAGTFLVYELTNKYLSYEPEF